MVRGKLVYLIVFLLALTAVLISIIPDLILLKRTPADTIFPLIHNHPEDYYYYLSLMRQGYDGHWLLTSYMTPENFSPAFVHTFYALTGHMAKWFNLTIVNVYFLSRIILGFLLILSSFFLAHKIFGSKKYFIRACIFLLINNGFWLIGFNNKQMDFHQYLSFWTRLDPVMRITYIPHHLFSTILAVWSVYFLSQALEKKLLRHCLLAGLLGFFAGFVYFATMLNLLGGLGMAVLMVSIYKIYLSYDYIKLKYLSRAGDAKEKKQPRGGMLFEHAHGLDPDVTSGEFGRCAKKSYRPQRLRQDSFYKIMLIAIYVILSGLSLIYLFYLSRTGFPWSGYNQVAEKFTFSFRLWEYILSLGPFFMLMLFGFKLIVKKLSVLSLMLLGWAIFPIPGIPLFRFFLPDLGDVYFLETATYIPIGILAGFGLMNLEIIFAKRLKIISALILIIVVIYSLIPFYFSIMSQSHQWTTYPYNIYLPREVVEAFKWLDENSPDKSIVLAGGFLGNVLPAYTHNKVVYGHPANTYAPAQKMEDAYRVFSPQNDTDAPAILKKYSVSYLFYSRDTDPPRQDLIEKWHLQKVFSSSSTSIYEKN
ncbi:hypothetical protein A3D03_03045 [Candidatus Gottesmanbacteria bacterium RIFCSPHIGHO2_02_FULL_40_13]|uniref:Glycosyltransferase RgtA/B/C/D-like domain-containing protein n=1 Tax=Candidatus Gottesmanbacteria bacterium RIFCSPHIGHO2_02_FULL_40_13 TaxID=1798384 RepID=A0A1F6AAZ9_9BACT|nr:MAG: hypothetical protein A3D03_03045 [Candidatus Gottesmanbacteria bacterium RIFCSPHIGHO2_02_FULL_40_13]